MTRLDFSTTIAAWTDYILQLQERPLDVPAPVAAAGFFQGLLLALAIIVLLAPLAASWLGADPGLVNLRRFYTRSLRAAAIGVTPDYLTAASILLRTEALKQTGLFDENFFMYWEDVDLCLRLKQNGWTLAVADGSKILHMEGSSSESIVKAYYEFHSVIYFASKYARHYIPAVCWIVFDRIIKRLAMLKFIWLFKFIVISFRYKQQVI